MILQTVIKCTSYRCIKFFRQFSNKFVIKNFENNPQTSSSLHMFFGSFLSTGFEICVAGNGLKPKNKGFITVGMRKLKDKVNYFIPHILSYVCIMNILDTEENKKFNRTFYFQFDSKNSQASYLYLEEKYIDRSVILNDASNVLQKTCLFITCEGTIYEWVAPKLGLIPSFLPEYNLNGFDIVKSKDGIKVFLRRDSMHSLWLRRESRYFQRVWDIPMKEKRKQHVVIQTDKMFAFLAMLNFIENDIISLNHTTIFDLYRIADEYDVERLLRECKKYLTEMISKESASRISSFAIFYNDTELQNAVEQYLKQFELQETTLDSEIESNPERNSFHSIFCDETKSETFEMYLEGLKRDIEWKFHNVQDIEDSISSSKERNFILYKTQQREFFDFYEGGLNIPNNISFMPYVK